MKKSNLFFSAAMALAMGSLASCTSDDLDQGNIVTPELTQSFANISIVMPNHAGTRVDDGTNVDDKYQDGNGFEYGTPDENKIGSILLVFYDAQGNVVGTSAPTDLGDKTTQTGGSVATLYKNTIELKLNEGASMPAQVMAYVNPANTTSQTDVLSRILLLTRTKDQLQQEGKGFLMNNSVYYENGVYKVAAQVNANFIYATEEDAKKDGAGSAAEIYVERVAAKVKVAMNPEGTITDYPVNTPEGTENTYALHFVPESWAITATAKNTMLIKNLNPTWADLTAAFSGASTDWVNGNHRSYWARSYGYMDGIGITGNPTFPEVGTDNNNNYLLDYVAYKDVTTPLKGEGADATYITMANTTPVYVGENTMRGARFNNPATFPNPYASVTSAIIKGHYEVTGDNADKFATGFYIRSLSKVNDQNVTVQVDAIYNDTELKNAMLKGQNIFRTTAPAEGQTEYTTDPAAVAITHLDNATDITNKPKKNPANRVTIQIPATYTGTLYTPTRDGATGTITWTAVTEANRGTEIARINGELEKFAGQASAYTNGAAFFYVPIKHNATSNSAYIETPVTGDYGIVRNHSYQLTINNISGLATGVLDENDNPLPDPTPTQTYFINATMNVLAWHIMANSVDL